MIGTGARKPARSRTGRKHRYRANACPPPGPRICAFCGSRRNIEVGHVNGREEDNSPANLIWTCRVDNVLCANAMRAAGEGRLTHQYNPTKRGGAANLAECLLAVGAITPRKGAKYAGSIRSPMKVHDAVEMIRAHHPREDRILRARSGRDGVREGRIARPQCRFETSARSLSENSMT